MQIRHLAVRYWVSSVAWWEYCSCKKKKKKHWERRRPFFKKSRLEHEMQMWIFLLSKPARKRVSKQPSKLAFLVQWAAFIHSLPIPCVLIVDLMRCTQQLAKGRGSFVLLIPIGQLIYASLADSLCVCVPHMRLCAWGGSFFLSWQQMTLEICYLVTNSCFSVGGTS